MAHLGLTLFKTIIPFFPPLSIGDALFYIFRHCVHFKGRYGKKFGRFANSHADLFFTVFAFLYNFLIKTRGRGETM